MTTSDRGKVREDLADRISSLADKVDTANRVSLAVREGTDSRSSLVIREDLAVKVRSSHERISFDR